METLDPVWERELRERTAAVLIKRTANTELRITLYRELLHSNPACFPEQWIRLPVTLTCTGSTEKMQRQAEKQLTSALKRSLFTVSADAPFSVTAVCSAENVKLNLIGSDGTVYFRYAHPAAISDAASAAVCINRFTAALFSVAVH